MDQNLIEYYRFLAEKGDVSAQVRVFSLFCSRMFIEVGLSGSNADLYSFFDERPCLF